MKRIIKEVLTEDPYYWDGYTISSNEFIEHLDKVLSKHCLDKQRVEEILFPLKSKLLSHCANKRNLTITYEMCKELIERIEELGYKMIEQEEFLAAVESIDDEKTKNIILSYVENIQGVRTIRPISRKATKKEIEDWNRHQWE